MHKFVRFKNTPIPRVERLRNGIITFVCSCGNLGHCSIRTFNKHTRCLQCTEKNIKFKRSDERLRDKDLEELFSWFYEKALEDYVNKIQQGEYYE